MAVTQTPARTVRPIQALQGRMGRVNHQPVSVHSYTNKRFTVNFRAPLDQIRRLLPPQIEPDEIGDTGYGMFGMCACDFWVTQLGWLPIPPVRNNDMLCRVSAKIRKRGTTYRAFYTIGSNSSSRLLGFLGQRFSHFRKRISDFERIDDGVEYFLQCTDNDPLAQGRLRAEMDCLSKITPEGTLFADIQQATDFVFNLDGSCGYDYDRNLLSFQQIDYPEWDMYFCHRYEYRFPLVDHLICHLDIEAQFDSVLFMQNTRQTWGASWMYAG